MANRLGDLDLDTPAVLVDLAILEPNLVGMAHRVQAAGARLRPHAKTHKSSRIAKRHVELCATGITVAKLGEAEVMAARGIDDIFVAFKPYVVRSGTESRALENARPDDS